MTEDDPVTAAEQRYTDLLHQTEQAKKELFDLCAQRVRDGLDTAETLAERAPFTAVTIRKALRERGVQPLPPGPKPVEDTLREGAAALGRAVGDVLRAAGADRKDAPSE